MIKYRQELHKLLPASPIVAELGCAEGLFSADILKWAGHLYMVDLWAFIPNQTGDGGSPQGWHDKNHNGAMSNVLFGSDRVTVLRGMTWDMASQVEDESLDMVYLDACHTYDCVMKDLAAWFPKVKKGGVIAGHDYLNKAYGVYPAVWNFTQGGRMYEVFTLTEDKDEDAGFYFYKP